MEPDRFAEEHRRGLTIDLGFAWTTSPGGHEIAFVDVPGHERFVPNMLAGTGPVPAALIVVAADEGWMPQSAEHLAALDAWHVRHGLLVVTRSDVADPEPARADALARIARTSLGAVPSVAVSARTGAGLGEVTAELDRLVGALPDADADGDVRLWIDRVFTVRGAGTVVTGTLGSGTLHTEQDLTTASTGRQVRVRGLQTLGRDVSEVSGVARVAVNLRGVGRADIARGDALLTPDAWLRAETMDVALHPEASTDLPSELLVHIGAAAAPAGVRKLSPSLVRLCLAKPLPLRVSDVVLLRAPGRRRIVGGATVLDVAPPVLQRRGAARQRVEQLEPLLSGSLQEATEQQLRHRRMVRASDLRAMGLPGSPSVVGQWCVDPRWWSDVAGRAGQVVDTWRRERPLDQGMPVEALRRHFDLPDRGLTEALAREAELTVAGGRVRSPGSGRALPPAVASAVEALERELRADPFAAPLSDRLRQLRLGRREVAAAVRAGRLLEITPGVVLLPDACERAAAVLADLAEPFTLSQARQALGTSRRVAVPLLELLDRFGTTRRLTDSTRTLRQ